MCVRIAEKAKMYFSQEKSTSNGNSCEWDIVNKDRITQAAQFYRNFVTTLCNNSLDFIINIYDTEIKMQICFADELVQIKLNYLNQIKFVYENIVR